VTAQELTPDLSILPSTRVAALLDRFPQLEDVLISLAPPFQKLKNPLLRKGVARVATLAHAAAVAGIPVADLVNKLRAAVGQPPFAPETPAHDEAEAESPASSAPPDWFDPAKIVATIDEKSSDPNRMPIVAVLQQAARLKPGQILELVTGYLPAPGIDVMKQKGLLVWSVQEAGLVRTYACKQPQ
jgi:hypothetical protein